MSGDRETCIDGGCDEYTTKPIKMDRLVEAIRSGRQHTVCVRRVRG
ncbi:MAG: CheY-like chemotaxis protein [Candidatus Paceibacteria bacterium]|jgi:CheY-like chemotaxis protein